MISYMRRIDLYNDKQAQKYALDHLLHFISLKYNYFN